VDLECINLVYTDSQRPFKSAFVALELFFPIFISLSFVGEIVGSLYPSTTDSQISNPCAYMYFFVLLLQNAYFCPSNCGIPFLYMFLSMIYLSVVKLVSEGTCYDTNCWITERGGGSIIEQSNPFQPKNASVISM
jgi:hypothetical protein